MITPTPPSLSIIIPARNEAQYLPRCLEAIRVACSRVATTAEIIVVLNRCTDETEAIARSAGCKIVTDESKNLAMIRNAGARAASGEVILTVDADSQMSANMIQVVLKTLQSPQVVGGGVLILPERWSLGILMTGVYLFPIAIWYGISGGLFFCRKKDFWEIGGFDESLASVEDIDFARRLKAHARQSNRKFKNLFRANIKTSCRKFDRFGDWYFVLRPWLIWELLKGRNQEQANRIWYDFPR